MAFLKKIKQKSKRLLMAFCLVVNFLVVTNAIMPRAVHASGLPCPGYGALYACIDVSSALTIASTYSLFSGFLGSATTLVLKQTAAWTANGAAFVKMLTDIIEGPMKNGNLGESASMGTTGRVRATASGALDDGIVKSKLLEAEFKLELQTDLNKMPISYLCNVTTISGSVPLLKQYKDGFTEHLVMGYNSVYRAPGSDGDGPQYAADAYRLRQGDYGSSGKGVAYCNPTDGGQCNAKNSRFYDAALMAGTLDFEHVYDVPKLVDHGDTVEYEPSNESEEMWMTAWQYCYNILGPRPSPLTGDNIETPKGKRQRTAYNQCVARQTNLAKACFERLAWISRPNCEDEHTGGFCNFGMKACEAAKSAGIALPPTFDCGKGLSYYQVKQLSLWECKAKERALQEAGAGAALKESIDSQSVCSKREALFNNSMSKLENSFRRAVLNTITLDSCWAQVK